MVSSPQKMQGRKIIRQTKHYSVQVIYILKIIYILGSISGLPIQSTNERAQRLFIRICCPKGLKVFSISDTIAGTRKAILKFCASGTYLSTLYFSGFPMLAKYKFPNHTDKKIRVPTLFKIKFSIILLSVIDSIPSMV